MSEISSKKPGANLTLKDQEWMDAALSLKKDKKRSYVKNLVCETKAVGSDKGYSVVAQKDLSPGEIVEECLTLVTTTGTKETTDPVLAIHTIQHPDKSNELFSSSGVPVIIGLGNFNLYRKSEDPNVVYSFDNNFNIVRMIAIKEIKTGDELTLERPVYKPGNISPNKKNKETKKDKESGGCGCGKKKKLNEQNAIPREEFEQQKMQELLKDIDRYPPNDPRSIVAKDKLQSATQFQSMIGNKDFKSIEIND